LPYLNAPIIGEICFPALKTLTTSETELNWEGKQERMGQKQRASSFEATVDIEAKKRRRVGIAAIGEFHLFC